MSPDVLDWKRGRVTYWDLHEFDAARPLAEQRILLKEDLAQVHYPCGVLLDVGWYGYTNGSFGVRVILDRDWENPRFLRECADAAALMQAMAAAIDVADRLATARRGARL